MSIKPGIGHSIATPDKQEGLTKIIGLHLKLSVAVMDNNAWVDRKYIYIDSFCGDGSPYRGAEASPIIFLRCLKASPLCKNSRVKVWFIDILDENIKALKVKFPCIPPCLNFICADSCLYVPQIADLHVKKESIGLLYIDPNGAPDISMLKVCSEKMPRVDFLIRTNCTALKRCKKYRVSNIIANTKKSTWLIRRPIPNDPWQWTFLFGTNFKGIKAWENAGFYRVDSIIGKNILNHLELTNDEKKELGITGISYDPTIKSYNLFEEEQ